MIFCDLWRVWCYSCTRWQQLYPHGLSGNHTGKLRQEHRDNYVHTCTRATVEWYIRLLKGRWLCLGSAGGTLLYTPGKVCNIILACGVLHKIAQDNQCHLMLSSQMNLCPESRGQHSPICGLQDLFSKDPGSWWLASTADGGHAPTGCLNLLG